MFGYVRPYKPDMLVKEYELYKSVYCALCKQLNKDYGILAKNILSYDSTFFCIVAAGINGVTPGVEKHSCMVNPLKKCVYCNNITPYLKMAAAFNVISFYHKLFDDINDEKLLRRLISRICLPFASHWRKKALKNFSEYDNIVADTIKQQRLCENDDYISIDKCADPTGIMLKRLMQTLAEDENKKEEYGRFGYFLGRWIYIIDACDDIESDIKNGSFNPIVEKYGITSQNYNDKHFVNECNELLNMTAGEITESFKNIEIKSFKPIVENVVYKGLGDMQRRILYCKEKL